MMPLSPGESASANLQCVTVARIVCWIAFAMVCLGPGLPADAAIEAKSGKSVTDFTRVESAALPGWLEELQERINRDAPALIAFQETRTYRFSRRERVFTGVIDRTFPDRIVFHYHAPERLVITMWDDRVHVDREGRERSFPVEAATGWIVRAGVVMDLSALAENATLSVRGDPAKWEVKVVPEDAGEVEAFRFFGTDNKVQTLILTMRGGGSRTFEFSAVDLDTGLPPAPGSDPTP